MGLLLLSQSIEGRSAAAIAQAHPRGFGYLLKDRVLDVPALVAQGRSNGAIAELLYLTGKTVESHISNILTKLDMPQAAEDHRRVLMVLAWLREADQGDAPL